jgi:hypothetical protein
MNYTHNNEVLYTMKPQSADKCHYYCFISTDNQEKLNKFIRNMETLQIVASTLCKYIQVVVSSDLTIPYNKLSNCYKLPIGFKWYDLCLGEFDDIVFYNFSNMDLCKHIEKEDALMRKGINLIMSDECQIVIPDLNIQLK